MIMGLTRSRKPVIIFLSDGQDQVNEGIVRNLCQSAIRLGYLPHKTKIVSPF